MRLAKADKEDIGKMMEFFSQWEMLKSCNWEIDQQYYDEETIEKMKRYMCENYEGRYGREKSIQDVKNLFFEDWFEKLECGWRRVVWGCDVLIDNCCNPDKDYLDFHPKFNLQEEEEEVLGENFETIDGINEDDKQWSKDTELDRIKEYGL